MTESTEVILRTDETDTEVELSAEDLFALSDSGLIGQRESGLPSQPPRAAANALPRKIEATRASTSRFAKAPRLSISLFVTIGIVGAAYVLTASTGTSQPTADTLARAPQSPWPAPEQKTEGEPVLFSNPFDAEEVFEFPAGTSETEAREAVAELLMERAMARQQT